MTSTTTRIKGLSYMGALFTAAGFIGALLMYAQYTRALAQNAFYGTLVGAATRAPADTYLLFTWVLGVVAGIGALMVVIAALGAYGRRD
jgi:hypothetical protein